MKTFGKKRMAGGSHSPASEWTEAVENHRGCWHDDCYLFWSEWEEEFFPLQDVADTYYWSPRQVADRMAEEHPFTFGLVPKMKELTS